MSRALLLVRFPDGDIRQGLYEGTADVVPPWLTDGDSWEMIYPLVRTVREPSPNFVPRSYDEQPEGDVFDVEIYSDYGYGFWWPGKAAKNLIVGPRGAGSWWTWDDREDAGFTADEYHVRPDWAQRWYTEYRDES